MVHHLAKYIIFSVIGNNDTYISEAIGSQSQVNSQLPEGASASIEKIGDKFKRKLRQTLNSMDQHSSGGMPAVQRARTTKRKGKYLIISLNIKTILIRNINSYPSLLLFA